ncbi:MAG: diguanylate cyclase [Pseudomonadota bacterium]
MQLQTTMLIPTLSRVPEADPALDQQQLYALGLDHIRRLSRRIWTDHNKHDPGITTLELLSYALTDLSYRAKFPLQDLLATETDNAQTMADQFFTPRQILPNRPLTAHDYRKILIDLKGVKNAWILPAEQHYFADTVKGELLRVHPGVAGIREIALKGLYKILLEFDESITAEENAEELQTNIKTEAMALLQANRNLCEDFVGIAVVNDHYYTLCAEIELESDADQSRIAAQIQFEVERYLAPPVLNYSLSEMLQKTHSDGTAYTVAEIFEGPLLKHGFIDDAELEAAELRSEIRLSDIISVIMDIPGVRAIRDIIVNPLSPGSSASDTAIAPGNPWRLEVPVGKRPRLSDSQGRLVFYKRQMPVSINATQKAATLTALNEARRIKLETVNEEDLPIPLGRFRKTASYTSFQHHFPVCYGLSEQGLPTQSDAQADAQRKALALQLKGYLLFFDQVMANYFAQLSSMRELFSRKISSATPPSYFAQLVDSFPDALRLYEEGLSTETLSSLLESDTDALARRNRFFDHLLARFAEDFHHYVNIMHSAFGEGAASALATKSAFLNDYPQLGAERSLAYNATLAEEQDLWNSYNISGLERRLARLLDIPGIYRRNLTSIPYDNYTEIEKTPDDEYGFKIKHPESGDILLLNSAWYPTEEDAFSIMIQAIEQAQSLDNFALKTEDDDTYTFDILSSEGESIAQHPEYFETEEAMNVAIDLLRSHLRKTYSGEGLYLIENLLLRPGGKTDPFLPICVDPTCSDCSDDDPYSYRLHIVLPAYAGRFQNMDFRRFVEETIRFETPAHLLPKICWVNEEDMALLEPAYRDWISLKAGADMTTDRADRVKKLNVLIDALYRVKNIYPSERLHDCGSEEKGSPFLLGRTSLGSIK